MRKVFVEGALDFVLYELFILQRKKLGLRIGGGGWKPGPLFGQHPIPKDC